MDLKFLLLFIVVSVECSSIIPNLNLEIEIIRTKCYVSRPSEDLEILNNLFFYGFVVNMVIIKYS